MKNGSERNKNEEHLGGCHNHPKEGGWRQWGGQRWTDFINRNWSAGMSEKQETMMSIYFVTGGYKDHPPRWRTWRWCFFITGMTPLSRVF